MPWLMNFQPKTGVGRFDLGLIGDNLFVRMKVNIGMGLAGGEQTTWNNKFEPLIKSYWENRFGFRKNGVTLKPDYTPATLDFFRTPGLVIVDVVQKYNYARSSSFYSSPTMNVQNILMYSCLLLNISVTVLVHIIIQPKSEVSVGTC